MGSAAMFRLVLCHGWCTRLNFSCISVNEYYRVVRNVIQWLQHRHDRRFGFKYTEDSTNHEHSSSIAAQTSEIFSHFGSHDWSTALASCRSKNTIQVATHGGKLHCWSGTILSSRTVHPNPVFGSWTSASSFCRPASLVPRCHGATAQKSSFSVAGPSAWNRLPMTLREAAVQLPRGSFKKDLKTYLFCDVAWQWQLRLARTVSDAAEKFTWGGATL